MATGLHCTGQLPEVGERLIIINETTRLSNYRANHSLTVDIYLSLLASIASTQFRVFFERIVNKAQLTVLSLVEIEDHVCLTVHC